jgi:hypothetical protein
MSSSALAELRLTLLYRDVDRLPYLCALRRCAAAYGLTVELVRHRQSGDEDWSEKLRRGEVDALAENYWGLQRLRAAGVPFVTVGSAAHVWTEWLLVRGALHAVDDLRGKRIAVRDHGPQRSLPTIVLRNLGLFDDVEQIVVEEKELGRWGVWKAVADGRCDACFMSPAYADAALAAGLRQIAVLPFAFEGGHIIPTTTEAVVGRAPQAIRALVRAMHDANGRVSSEPGWVLDVVNADCLADLREHFVLDSDADKARIVGHLVSEVGGSPLPTIAGLANALEIARAQYGGLDDFNPLEMWDMSFARETLGA